MKTHLECLPCLARNAVDIAKRITPDLALRKAIVAEAMHALAEEDMQMPPPFLARKIIDLALRKTGGTCPDPYREEKEKSTVLAKKLLLELPQIAEYAPESFESRLRLAVAGNILDFGIFSDLDQESALQSVRQAFTKPLDREAVFRLQARMDSARRILYILDNCGEAVFDRVFLEPYRGKCLVAVRGRAAFNDMTREELEDSGFIGFSGQVVDNGSGVPGTILAYTGNSFQKAFAEADLIVAKGQGNFETLNETDHPIAFLFLAKCPVVTREIGAEPNSIQVRIRNF